MAQVTLRVRVVLVTGSGGQVLVGGVGRVVRRTDVVVARLVVERLHLVCPGVSNMSCSCSLTLRVVVGREMRRRAMAVGVVDALADDALVC